MQLSGVMLDAVLHQVKQLQQNPLLVKQIIGINTIIIYVALFCLVNHSGTF